LPNTCIVMGGTQATVVAEESMATFPWIDYVVRGEAENVILDFLQLVSCKKKPHEIPSLTYRQNSKIRSTPLGPLISDMDSLPLPDYRTYPLFEKAITQGNNGNKEKYLPLEPGRGCPYECSFCSTSTFWRRRWRKKSPDLLAHQIKTASQMYNVEHIFLVQDLFAADQEWLSYFLRAMEGSSPTSWTCYLRPDSVGVEAFAYMQRAGCRSIFFGVESGSQRTLKRIGKNIDIPRTCEIIEAAVASGIMVLTSFVVGFPWETAEDLQDTLSLHHHFLNIGVQKSQVLMLCPLPKTQITIQYTSRLKLDLVLSPLRWGASSVSTKLEYLRNSEINRMIRQYPQIFSSFYYLKPEFLSRKEILFAVYAANALSEVERAVKS